MPKDKKDCPRGFVWCTIKKQCIPEGEKERLMKKHQRYFFKGDKKMSKLKEANELVDIAFDESFEVFGKIKKAEKEMERILDMCRKIRKEEEDLNECDMMGMPAETEEEYMDTYEAEPNDEPNDISHVPNQDAMGLYNSVRKQLGEIKRLSEDEKAEYKKYFYSVLKKYGATSPAQLDAAKKKEFFDKVDSGWKSKKENVNEIKDIKGNKVPGVFDFVFTRGLKIYRTVKKNEIRKCSGKLLKDPICKREAGIKGAMAAINYVKTTPCPKYKKPSLNKQCIENKKDAIRDWLWDIREYKKEIKKIQSKK